jgi:predicted metal-dependent hydrolase
MNFDYQIRRSARAKNTRLVVKPDKIEVVAPPHISEKQIKAFVAQHQDWLRQAVQRVEDKASVNSLAPSEYRDGILVPFQDSQLLLNLSFHPAKTLKIHHLASDDKLLVKLPLNLAPEQHSDNIRHALTAWMKRQAQLQAQSGSAPPLQPAGGKALSAGCYCHCQAVTEDGGWICNR